VLEERVFLVTGASRGIGRATAIAIARAGGHVTVAARDLQACETVVAEICAAGGEALAYQADVTCEDDMVGLVLATITRFGRIDGAFLNAGTIMPPQPLEAIDAERFDAVIGVNLKGPFLALKAIIPHIAQPGGSIVVNSAGSGLRGRPLMSEYCASKWGVIGLSLAAAQELAPRGIRVNVIAPGYIATDSWAAMLGNHAPALASRVPLRTLGTPEQIAKSVLWLLGDASDYVTGTVLPIDGGLSGI
jgi:NAD(P)-dependent dehydrogenase (short-subunit alcohol dehydrogenase family)